MKLDSTPTPKILHTLASVLLGLLVACSGDPQSNTPDAGTVRDAGSDVVGPPIDAILDPVADIEVTYAATLADGTIVADRPRGLARVQSSTVVEIGDQAGEVVAVAELDGGALVAGAFGLFALVNDSLQRSPIVDVIGTVVPTDVLVAPGGRVWMATNRGLFSWRNGESFQIQPEGLPDRDARLTYGAPIEGVSATWVAAGGRLYGIRIDDGAPRAYPQALEADIVSLATASDRALWIVERGGILRSRQANGVWRLHDVVSDAVQVIASSDGAVWIQTMTGLWRHHDGEFREVRGAPPYVHSPSEDGSILAGRDRLVRVFAGLAVKFAGLDDGALVVANTTVEVLPLLPQRVTAVSATLDDAAIDAGSGPWAIALDTAGLSDGTHVLGVTATYDDGSSATAELRFSYFMGPVPNWTDNVQPLFVEHCTLCHGSLGSARRLDTLEEWRDEIDLILFNVREGRMPLMPNRLLTPAEIGVIEGWAAASFPIGGE